MESEYDSPSCIMIQRHFEERKYARNRADRQDMEWRYIYAGISRKKCI